MQIDYIPIDRLSVSKANMRQGKKPPDVSDILPSVIKRGVIIPVIVRPNCNEGHFEICAGKRRYFASLAAQAAGKEDVQLPCITIAANDDADALEISMIENMLRQAPDPVTQWESYTRLVKEGRTVDDIAATFALTELQVKRILALGNLLPRIRDAYRAEEIDATSIRHLTLATKAQQKAWLALYDDEEAYTPHGHQLKAWLFGGASISTSVALFDLADYKGRIVADLFDEGGYFGDADEFLTAQMAEIEKRKAAYIEDGWSDVIVLPVSHYFSTYDHRATPKRKGGRVYVSIHSNGEVSFHEGYLTEKEAKRLDKGESPNAASKAVRPEITSAMTDYVNLHRHAAVRNELAGHPHIALRVMVAHAICRSPLWKVEVQSQRNRNEAVTESIASSVAEARFAERRSAILAVLGFDEDEKGVTLGHEPANGITGLFARLLDLPDPVVLEVLALVMAETLASGTDLIETLGVELRVDMADYWVADDAFYALVRDREVSTAMLSEVGGATVAQANANEKVKTIKSVINDHLTGEGGRAKRDKWIPRWMAFPPTAYTQRGGVATVAHATRAKWLAEADEPPFDPDPPQAAAAVEPEPDGDAIQPDEEAEEERLAA
jgi:ParB family transcriptional regulator, chromosome partitioning protein